MRVPAIGRWIAGALAALAVAVLLGWWLDIELLKAPLPGSRAMVPNTAAMFLLSSLALALAVPVGRVRRRWIGRAAALVVVVAATAFAAEHVLGTELGLDHLLADVEPTRPALETSVTFLLLALALALPDRAQVRGAVLAELAALGGMLFPLLVSVGYVYDYAYFSYLVSPFPLGMAVHTAVGTLMLGAGILLVRPERGVMRILTSAYLGGTLVRRLLVVVAVTIPIAGALSVELQRAGAYPAPGAAVVSATLSLVVVLGALVVSGRALDRADRDRRQAEAELGAWKHFFDGARFGAVIESGGQLLRFNDAFARMHGWPAGDRTPRTMASCQSPAALAALPARLAEVDSPGGARFESEHVHADGHVFSVAIDAIAVRDEVGAVLYRLAYVQDISEERRSRADQARLASIVASASDAIAALDPRGDVLAWNRGAEQLSGYSAAEVLGGPAPLLDPGERAGLLARLERGEVVEGEAERVRKDGSRVVVSLKATPIVGFGETTYSVIARDVTAQRAAARAVAEANEELERVSRAKLTISEAIAGMAATGLDEVLRVIAREASDLTGAERVAVVVPGQPPRSAIAGMSEAQIAALGGVPAAVASIVAAADDGLHVPVAFRDELRGDLWLAGKPGGFAPRDRRIVQALSAHLSSAIEISLLYEREAVERARFESVLAQMPEAVIILDARGEPVHENPAALAYVAGPEVGQRYDVRWPSGERVPVPELPLARAFAAGETSIGVELAVQTQAGELVPILGSAAPIEQGGARIGAVAVFRDIRTIKALERLRQEWTSVVAHDLRQPLNAMMLSADLLIRSPLSEPAATAARRVRREVVRLDAMIQDLLDASLVEARRIVLQRAPIRPCELVEAALARVSDVAPRCAVDVAADLPPVLVDEARILQVLGNLLSNAVKYGELGSPITIAATADGDAVRITVGNRGPGIGADELPALFERFTRTGAARRGRVQGIGLGLYICRGLIEAHGGRIWAESTPGETTRFHVTLPVATAESAPDADDLDEPARSAG